MPEASERSVEFLKHCCFAHNFSPLFLAVCVCDVFFWFGNTCPFVAPSNEKRASYQAELLEQMEADRLRKTQEKDEAQRFDQRSELDTLEYNPWGRGGGGAPLKDSGGNLQTFRRGLNAMNGVNRPGANVYDNSPHTHDGQRKVPEKWHEGHWPLPEEKPPKPKLNYQDELREQIEEKKRRERAEKDEQRREEERLHNRLEEQRRKIQSEFDAEQEKQRRREEEQKRKNKVLIDAQQETKNSKRRPVEKEWWEKEAEKKPQEVEPAPQPMQRMSSSPPLPSIRVQEVMSATPRSISPRRQTPHAEVRSRSRPATVTPPEKDVSEVTVEQVIEKPESRPPTSRGRGDVLTQLTAMRRQLQLEQERLQRQMKKDDRYEVYDPRIDDRPRYSAAPSKAKDYEAYNGLDPEEIARKNRERLKQLEEWRKKDFSDPGDRFIDTNSRAGIRDLGGSGGRGGGGGAAENDDDVLARFLSNHSSERL